jgi:hypothetical protein
MVMRSRTVEPPTFSRGGMSVQRAETTYTPAYRSLGQMSDVRQLAIDRSGSKPYVFGQVMQDDQVVVETRPHGHTGDFDWLHLHVTGAQEVQQAMERWWPKLLSGGMISGHGGAEGATAFVQQLGLPAPARITGSSWLVHKPIVIDAMYCINLPERQDRALAVQTELRKVGLLDRVEMFPAIEGKTLPPSGSLRTGQIGCVASHMAVLHRAAAKGAKHVLILEDDVEFVPSFASALAMALSRCPASYEILYVGATVRQEWGCYLQRMDDLVSRAGRVLSTSSYLVNMSVAPELHRSMDSRRYVIDTFLADRIQPKGNCYVCTPYLTSQVSGHSDVMGRFRSSAGDMQYVWKE